MSKSKERAGHQYYWIKTNGLKIKQVPFYFNGSSWKATIDDRDLFISDYKLKLLYGKDCVLRAINEETDLIETKDIEPTNSFLPALVKADSGHNIVFNVHPNLKMAHHNGMLVPMPFKNIVGFLTYPEDYFDPQEEYNA